jgi:hypothetical protein
VLAAFWAVRFCAVVAAVLVVLAGGDWLVAAPMMTKTTNSAMTVDQTRCRRDQAYISASNEYGAGLAGRRPGSAGWPDGMDI